MTEIVGFDRCLEFAGLTSVRFNSAMDVHMRRELGLSRASVVTLGASKGLFASMSIHVVDQSLPDEGLELTKFATKGFDVGVDAGVTHEVFLGCCGELTHLTCIRSEAGVIPHVDSESGLGGSLVVARGAGKRFFSCMGKDVMIEGLFYGGAELAYGTRIWFFTSMRTHVFS